MDNNFNYEGKREQRKEVVRCTIKGRCKEICALCDKVQQRLCIHLRRVHSLAKDSSQYKAAMETAQYYLGASKEIDVDVRIVHEKKRKAQEQSSFHGNAKKKRKTNEASDNDDDEWDFEPSSKEKVNLGLEFLVAELPDDDDSDIESKESSDKECKPEYTTDTSDVDAIPPSPQAASSAVRRVQPEISNSKLPDDANYMTSGLQTMRNNEI